MDRRVRDEIPKYKVNGLVVAIKASTFSKDESYQLIFQTTTPMKGDPVRYVMRQRYMFGARPETPSADTELDVVELECVIMELGPTIGSIEKYKAEALGNQAASDSFNADSDGDGISDMHEEEAGTDPKRPDSD